MSQKLTETRESWRSNNLEKGSDSSGCGRGGRGGGHGGVNDGSGGLRSDPVLSCELFGEHVGVDLGDKDEALRRAVVEEHHTSLCVCR